MKARLRHIGIVVKDLAKSVAFYQELGFGTIISKQAECTDKDTIYTVKLNSETELTYGRCTDKGSLIKLNNQIELIQGPWMNHFALTVDSLDRFELPDKPIFSKETDKVKVCYIMDPDGNVIELVEEK